MPPENRYGNALITGASSGIGRALALWFARRGTAVWGAARRTSALEALASEAAAFGGRVVPVPLDVADARGTVERVRELDEACGGFDLVVANAGVAATTDGRDLSWSAVEEILRVNVVGAAATLAAAAPAMAGRGRGHLAGVSSLAAWRGMARGCAYSASKAFLATFLEGLRVDLRGAGVRVTCVLPGYVVSEIPAARRRPFLVGTDDAAARIGAAILRGDATYAFPFPLRTIARAVRMLPDGLYDRLARRR